MLIKTGADTKTFPKTDLEVLLCDELIMAAEVEANIQGTALPASTAIAVLAPVPLDSLAVVDLLCSVEPLLGFAPKSATVKTGGYNSVQEAMDHLLPRLEEQWQKNQGKPK